MWEIREDNDFREDDYKYGHRMGYKHDSSEAEKAYECGLEDGYKKAMKEFEMSSRYGERRGRM